MPAAGGLDSDVYLRLRLAPHPVFDRSGDNLEVEVDVPLTTPVLGGMVHVPTLDGTVEMKIPQGTPTTRLFRLRGHGLNRPDKTRGDLLVALNVDVPTQLSAGEREIFEKLRELGR